jgi:hypothetical protein
VAGSRRERVQITCFDFAQHERNRPSNVIRLLDGVAPGLCRSEHFVQRDPDARSGAATGGLAVSAESVPLSAAALQIAGAMPRPSAAASVASLPTRGVLARCAALGAAAGSVLPMTRHLGGARCGLATGAGDAVWSRAGHAPPRPRRIRSRGSVRPRRRCRLAPLGPPRRPRRAADGPNGSATRSVRGNRTGRSW